jgi:cytochrome bd-type quinol oxidase subunit 2
MIKNKALKRISSALIALHITALSILPALADSTTSSDSTTTTVVASGDGTTHIVTALNTIPGMLKQIGTPLAVIFLIAAFILMMTGTEGSQKSKKWIAYICVAIAGITLAAQVVSAIQGNVQ